jgi:hypothetical protein
MVAVAITALVLGAERVVRRWQALRQRAEEHVATLETLALIREKGAYPYCGLGLSGVPRAYNAGTASFHADCVSYHIRMMRKYQLAMRRPWLPVEPDPPRPEP